MNKTEYLKCLNPKCNSKTRVDSIPRTLSDGRINTDYKETAICSSCGSDILIPEQTRPTNDSPIKAIEMVLDEN